MDDGVQAGTMVRRLLLLYPKEKEKGWRQRGIMRFSRTRRRPAGSPPSHDHTTMTTKPVVSTRSTVLLPAPSPRFVAVLLSLLLSTTTADAAAFTSRPSVLVTRRAVVANDVNNRLWIPSLHNAGAVATEIVTSSSSAAAPSVLLAAILVDNNPPPPADPATVVWWANVIPFLIAGVAYAFLNPGTGDSLREYWQDQFETANSGPLIVDYEPVELQAKYALTKSDETDAGPKRSSTAEKTETVVASETTTTTSSSIPAATTTTSSHSHSQPPRKTLGRRAHFAVELRHRNGPRRQGH